MRLRNFNLAINRYIVTVGKRIILYHGNAVWDENLCQPIAGVKRAIAYVCNGVGNGYVFHAGTIAKRIIWY